jgi:hypothetical protein
LLSSPRFIPPHDAFVNAIAAAAILIPLDLTRTDNLQHSLDVLRWCSVAYCVFVVLLSLLAVWFYEANRDSLATRISFKITEILGQGEILYTPGALISIVGGYHESPIWLGWLTILWTGFIIAPPVELFARLLTEWRNRRLTPPVGIIERFDSPNIVRVHLNSGVSWKPNKIHIAALSDGDQQYVISLFEQIQSSRVLGTGICVGRVNDASQLERGQVCYAHSEERLTELMKPLAGTKDTQLIGYTVEGSIINTVTFEVTISDPLGTSHVIFLRINDKNIYYQILEARTAKETFDNNPRGKQLVTAAQLGSYEPIDGFKKYDWVPEMNTPVFLAKDHHFIEPNPTERQFVIDHVSSTNIGVLVDIDDLLECHTAIFGATGTGKTELALNIIREAVRRNVKVFCVDVTGQYRILLRKSGPIVWRAKDDGDMKGDPSSLSPADQSALLHFLNGNDDQLAILELGMNITEKKANIECIAPYLHAIASWAQSNDKSHQKLLIVLEEAHVLVPESRGINPISQIALQGRKYGLGFMIVSQRTALVSKSVLYQCNTFFTHCLIDQTALNLLQSVYGEQHTRSLPNLRKFEFLAFGHAVRTERPIIIKRPFIEAKNQESENFIPFYEEAPSIDA